MIRGIYTAAAGMAAEMARAEVLANNLANVNTAGFKEDVAVFRSRSDKTIYRHEADGSPTGSVQKMGDLTTGVFLDQIATYQSTGALHQTNEPLDLAINGDGFFVVQGPNGEDLLTRGGSFSRDAHGYMVDSSNRQVLGTTGPIRFVDKSPVSITEQGVVSQGKHTLGQLRLVKVEKPEQSIEKRGDTAWTIKQPDKVLAERPQVLQGYVESANINPTRSMVQMISAQRSYEASQHMITAQDETLAKAVNDLGRA